MKGLDALISTEHMTEDALGQHAEQLHTDIALLQHRQANGIDPEAISAEWCEDCGNEIPELRRQALPGVTQCVDCAREAERLQRMYT